MAKTFSAQIEAWARKGRGRMEAIFRESTQRVLEDANEPMADGGRMRIKTGFLRNSLAASLQGMPRGPSRREDGQGRPEDINLIIARAQVGDTIWAGWTAAYAAPREAKDGFLESAAQRWPQTVSAVTAEAKRRLP